MGKWPMVKLGEVLHLQDNAVPSSELSTVNLAGVYSFGRGLFKRGPMSPMDTTYKTFNRLVTNDFVISQPKAWEGALALVTEEFDGWFLSPVFPTFRADPNRLDPSYLSWFCKQSPVWAELQFKSRGIGARRESVSPKQFLSIEIPLPPLAEQRRIVAKIDALAAKIDETRGLRKQAGDEAEAVRTSGINEVFSTLGKTVRPMPLEALSDCRLGKMLSQNLTEGSDGTPYLRNANVQWDYLDLSSIYRMKIGLNELQTYLLHPGDILVCEGGDIGKSAIFNGEIEGCIFQKALHRVRVFKEKAIPRFILYHIFWGAAQGHFSEIKTQTTIAHLTGVKLKKYGILCPPIPEQRRIVTRLDALQAQVDVLKQAQAASAAELDALLPSVLDRAFKGEAT